MPDRHDLNDVVTREKQLLDSAVRGAPQQVAELLHRDFVEFGASGRVWSRSTIVESLVASPEPSGEATGFEPVCLADDVILLTYRVEGSVASLRSSLWIRDRGGEWRLRFHQGTRSA